MNALSNIYGFLSPPIRFALVHLATMFDGFAPAKAIGSFGLAIIAVTLAIRILLIPVYRWQLRTMSRTQNQQRVLAKPTKELRAKYKGQPTKVTEELNKMYAELGIHPLANLGGCLPVLVQLPILGGLYIGIRAAAAEYHGEHSFLFIHDVSRSALAECCQGRAGGIVNDILGLVGHPAVLVIPVIAAALSFVQSKLMMRPPSPNLSDQERAALQVTQRTAYFFPVLYLFFSVSLQQGLPIYWVTQSLFMIVQLYISPLRESVNVGGKAVGDYLPDRYIAKGGAIIDRPEPLSTDGAHQPAPSGVYGHERTGSFGYVFDGLTPGGWYSLRLHFAESEVSEPGQRVFNVTVHRRPALRDLDVVARAGGRDRLLIESVLTQAGADGAIDLRFVPVRGQATLRALDLTRHRLKPRDLSAGIAADGVRSAGPDLAPASAGLQDEPDRLTNADGGAVRSAARNGSRRGEGIGRSNANGNGQHRPAATGGPLAGDDGPLGGVKGNGDGGVAAVAAPPRPAGAPQPRRAGHKSGKRKRR
ncbi:MAG: membrane protein insertase YidC [Candidatus Dormibacteria bacterium]